MPRVLSRRRHHRQTAGSKKRDDGVARAQLVDTQRDPALPREYSIASVPGEGGIVLFVRLQRHADGSPGAASGWLCLGGAGDTVALRVRPHARFRLGDNARRPLILIGNGSGLAGLRAHLKARIDAGDERYLSERDRGEVRGFVRDWVDSKRFFNNYVMPAALVLLVIMLIGTWLPRVSAVLSLLSLLFMLTIFIEGFIIGNRANRAVRAKFPEADTGFGLGMYAFSRATQPRPTSASATSVAERRAMRSSSARTEGRIPPGLPDSTRSARDWEGVTCHSESASA